MAVESEAEGSTSWHDFRSAYDKDLEKEMSEFKQRVGELTSRCLRIRR